MHARVERLQWPDLAARTCEWERLADEALEPNVFLEPGFALAAAQHLAPSPQPDFLVVTSRESPSEWRALCPVILPRRGGSAIARSWIHPYSTSATPLLDKHFAREGFDAIMQWLEAEQRQVAALELRGLASSGRVMGVVRESLAASGKPCHTLGSAHRAILRRAAPIPHGRGAEAPSKTLARNLRRLSQIGRVDYRSLRTPSGVRRGLENFLALEASGWKGRRGTALLSDPAYATFARSMTRLLSRRGGCRIECLELDSAPIAMLIILTSQDQDYTWKIAFDEKYAAFSPGAQIMFEFTRRQLRAQPPRATDSCADASNHLVERLWPDKTEIVDIMVATRGDDSGKFQIAYEREKLRRRLRRSVKELYSAALSRS